MKTKTTLFSEKYNTAIGEAYYRSIKQLIRKYYNSVSENAIDEYIRTGDFADLTAAELLASSGFDLHMLDRDIKYTATKFVYNLELQSNAAYRKAYNEAQKPIPPQLVRPTATRSTNNLITQQVQKIKGLCDYQYSKIDSALQDTITEGRSLTYFKQQLRESGIANEKRIRTIAHNQLHNATNMVNINKALELDLTKAIWRHPPNSVYKTEPRPSHKHADGKIFNLKKGCKIDGEFIFPGQLPNCKCYYELVI